jgi:hypothetical protein
VVYRQPVYRTAPVYVVPQPIYYAQPSYYVGPPVYISGFYGPRHGGHFRHGHHGWGR